MYDKVLGALMIGSWANSSLYIIEVMQAYKYFENFGGDHLYVKLAICLCLAFDTISIAANYGGVYLYSVVHWGDVAYVQNEYWPLYLYIITTGCTAFVVQNFLIFRYWRATRGFVTALLLMLTSLTALAGSIATLVIIVQYSTYAERDHVVAPVIIWLVASACADIALALTLVWQLRGMKSAFKSTQSVIKRLIASSIQTGTVTSLVATIVLVTYLSDKESNVTVGIGFCLGRIYTLTLFYNLNNRGRSTVTDGSSGGPQTLHVQDRHPVGTESMGGIHIHRTAIVKIDEEENKSYLADGDRRSEHTHKDVF
ncbi:hypothetical protein FB451DRAFT_588791 [Mycena latifolia]|nr:hypothetical protein FB451DRAFT_588791 [Mycena latifolia]